MKPTPKVSRKKQDADVTDKEKVAALTAENLALQRKMAKYYASNVSLQNQVRALQENENKRAHSSALANAGLVGSAGDLLEKYTKKKA